MTSHTSTSRSSVWIGIVLGVVFLGLLAAFAIGLPKANGDDASAEPEQLTITLPDSLSGGYVASDDPAAFAGGQLADQADQIAAQEKAAAAYGDQVLPKVLGTAAATRTYVADGTQAVFVQAFQSSGGAFAPNSLPDPESTGGQASTEMVAVGDGACILTYGQSSTGQAATAPAFSQCQVSSGGLTVQIGSSAVAADDLVTAADKLLVSLQPDQDQ